MLYLGMDRDREKCDVPAVDPVVMTAVYFGQTVPVEPWATHIATDKDGKVHCYAAEPIWYEGDCEWLMSNHCTMVRYCGEVDLEGMDWTETCLEIVK